MTYASINAPTTPYVFASKQKKQIRQRGKFQRKAKVVHQFNRFPNVTPRAIQATQAVITLETVQLPESFDAILNQIDLFKAGYRKAKYQLVASVYAACQVGFKDKSLSELEANSKLLDEKCARAEIDGSTYYHKLGKLAFGDDAKRISSIVHVIKVAEKHNVEIAGFVAWVEREQGLQKIRTTYNTDGTRKKAKQTKGPGQKASDTSDKPYADKARELLRDKSEATLPIGQIPMVAPLGDETDCTAILRQLADGSFIIKVVFADENVVESTYAAYGRKQAKFSA